LFRRKTTAPAKKVWRISDSAPKGEWVDRANPVVTSGKDLPEVSYGTWVMSSYDLLDGTDVTEEALPGALFDELFAPKQDERKKTRE
jgi:hypothetical protein